MMCGFQAAGAAPLVTGQPVAKSRDDRNCDSYRKSCIMAIKQLQRAMTSGGLIDSVTDEEILSAYRLLAGKEGIFC
jgi:threonine synthase